MNRRESQRPGTNFEVIEFPRRNGAVPGEEAIEARLRELTYLVNDLCESGYAVLLMEGTPGRQAFDELRVKEAALRWIVRVAKHSSGAAREKLWADIESAVGDLEGVAESVMNPSAARNYPEAQTRLHIHAGHTRVRSH